MASAGADANHGNWVIVLTLTLSLMLGITPLPEALQPLRPDFALLGLIYWCLALPQRVGVISGWLLGLLQDVLNATLLGQHALIYALIALISLKFYQRIRLFPLWQQAFGIALLLALNSALHLWVYQITGHRPLQLTYWLPVLTGALLWPAWYLGLRRIRRQFRIA